MSKFNSRFIKTIILSWISTLIIILITSQISHSVSKVSLDILNSTILKAIVPLLVCALIIGIVNKTPEKITPLIKYSLFFLVSITSIFGLTQTLTGSHAESENILLYGLSFYTAAIAYYIHKKELSLKSSLIISNPILLITGPVAVLFKPIKHRRFKKRFTYYAPYVVLGIFLHQAISTPLTESLHLIKNTDLISSLAFASIFELFVYANFCGLSLIIYGVLGIYGIKIPLNFRQPFSSTNLVDFWKGWHTSLSMVLKPLFYTPVKKSLGTSCAIFVVYISSAMWHGVTFNFLAWGCLHAALFIITLHFLRKKIYFLTPIIMIIGIVIGRMLFADASTDRLLLKLEFNYNGTAFLEEIKKLPDRTKFTMFLGFSFIFCEFVFRNKPLFRKRNYKFYRLPIVQLLLIVITLSIISNNLGIDYAVYGQR